MSTISKENQAILDKFAAKKSAKGMAKKLVDKTAVMSGTGKVSQNRPLWSKEYSDLRCEIMQFGNDCRADVEIGYTILSYSSGKWSLTSRNADDLALGKAKLAEWKAKFPSVA